MEIPVRALQEWHQILRESKKPIKLVRRSEEVMRFSEKEK